MKKLFTTILLLLAVGIFTTGCGKEEIANCEELDTTQCAEYSEQCKVCPDFINSPYQNCHDVAFCRNFENLE